MGNICSFGDDKPKSSNRPVVEPTAESNNNKPLPADKKAQACEAADKIKKIKKIEELKCDDITSDDDDDDNIHAQEVENNNDGEEHEEETLHQEGDQAGNKSRGGRLLVLKKPEADAPKVKSLFRIIKTRVHHVYDGDTITINLPDPKNPGELTRVRLVGVDAPEIKEGEDCAQESKKLVQQLCDKQDVEIEVDTREECDKYGRMIGRVFVTKSNGNRININNQIIGLGLANVYFPGHSKAFLELKDQMLAKQREAIKQRLGIWRNFVDNEVYKTRNGGSYHKKDCEHVSKFRLEKIRRSECLEQGLSGCRTCNP